MNVEGEGGNGTWAYTSLTLNYNDISLKGFEIEILYSILRPLNKF